MLVLKNYSIMKRIVNLKKNIVQVSLVLICSITFSNAYSQFAIGLGGAYGTDIEQFAPNLRVYYFPNEKICFGPEIAYFPSITEKIHGIEVEKQLTEYNLTGHYIFELSPKLGVYPLFGLNYSVEKETEYEDEHKIEMTEDAFGANLGAGLHLALGRFLPFAEYKYVTGNLRQHAFSIGVLFTFEKEEEKEIEIE